MATASLSITNSLDGTLITATDTGTGYGTIVSRTLVIKDANGVVLDTINMGTTLVETYAITKDQYLNFTLTVVDNTGTYTATVNYLAQNFYIASYLAVMAYSGGGLAGDFCNLDKAELFYLAANRFALAGLGIAANNNIIMANFYVTQ